MESQQGNGSKQQEQHTSPLLVIPKVQLLSDDPNSDDLSLTPIPLSPSPDIMNSTDDYFSPSNVPSDAPGGSRGVSRDRSSPGSPASSAVSVAEDPQSLEEESRKIQENLRQWKDRDQRRRAQNRRSSAFINPASSTPLASIPISEAVADLTHRGSSLITRATVRRQSHLPRSNSSNNGGNLFRMSFSRRSVHVPGSSRLNDVELDERSSSAYSHPLDPLDESGEQPQRHELRSVENNSHVLDSTTNLTGKYPSDREVIAQGVDFVSTQPLQTSYSDNDTNASPHKPHYIQTNPLPPAVRHTYEYSSPSDISESPVSAKTYRIPLVNSQSSQDSYDNKKTPKAIYSQSSASLNSSTSSSSERKAITTTIQTDIDPKSVDIGLPSSSYSDKQDPYATLQTQQKQNNQLAIHSNASEGGLLSGRRRRELDAIADEKEPSSSSLCVYPAMMLQSCFTCFVSCCCAGENAYLREQEDEQAARTNPME